MKDWTPKPVPTLDYTGLTLTGEEGYVLSRIDGTTSMGQLSMLTGMPPERIQAIVGRLVDGGAVARDGGPAVEPGGPTAAGSTAIPVGAHSAAPAAESPAMSDEGPTAAAPPSPRPASTARRGPGRETAELEEETASTNEAEEAEALPAGEALDPDAEPADAEMAAQDAYNYRKIFETELHPLPRDQRAELALTAEDPALSAFCFDPDPMVIRSVFHNPLRGLQHARLMAAHHHNATGLMAFVDHPDFLRDLQVQRMLLRNPQLPEMVFRKFMTNKRLIDLYRILAGREVSERSRTATRMLLRQRFASGPAEERIDLLFITEGRVLPTLAGINFDSKMIFLLCSRSFGSSLLIQNLARFATTPAPVLAHLLKQQAVQRQPQLRQMLLQHPHMPMDARRRLGAER